MTYVYRNSKSSRPRTIAIVGSRHITDYRKFCTTIRPLVHPSYVIVSGAADGVDTLAAKYARQNKHQLTEYPVDMKLVRAKEQEGLERSAAFGFAAHARNQSIVDDADLMIAIACGHSRGTYDSIAKFKRKLQQLGLTNGSPIIYLYAYLWDCPEGLKQYRKGGKHALNPD